ncbi:MAG: SGNH/GDSL hydrolase family protein [Nitrospirae bacterium]|nr:SGNH/GDSL hydrolase family protein [Nitrospirota bacterium]
MKIKTPGWKDAAALFVGCVVAAVIFEVFLRLYNPIHFTVRGDNITLPANESFKIENPNIHNLDKLITVRRNSIGFRGAEPPANLTGYISIVAVGGSTTECFYISDGKTWTDLLGDKLRNNFNHIWINNAGLAGHSTAGHYILMKNYITRLRPKVALFLVGANDIQKTGASADELKIVSKATSLVNYLATKSETVYLLQNLYRYREAGKRHLYTEPFNVYEEKPLVITAPEMANLKQQAQMGHASALKAYGERLNRLLDITINSSIVPVLITQPILYGNAIDNSSGVNLGTIKFGGNLNGELMWHMIEMYNDVTRKTAVQRNVFIIDLSRELSKDSSYYYDWLHYSNAGAVYIADIIYKDLCPFLREKYPEAATGKCP